MIKKGLFLKTMAIAVMGSAVIFSACNKSDLDDNNPDEQAAGLMAFNLAPDKTVAFTIGGNVLPGSPLAFNSFSGAYLPVFPGSRTVEALDYANNASLATTSDSFAVGKYYSVFIVGTGGTYQNVLVQDNVDSLSSSSGQAYIRYIHAINGSANATVTISGSSADNSNIAFGSISDFIAVTPGSTTVSVTDGASVDVNRTITTEAKKVYTVLLTSGATSTDPAQIKFITNGTLDDEASGQRISSSARTSAIN